MGIQSKGGREATRIRRYQTYAKSVRPKKTLAVNMAWAFAVGGIISAAGQAVIWIFTRFGFSATSAAAPTSIVMVGIGALLTGLGWYDRIVKRAGMGGTLPITGFANAMVAPAMEYRAEGPVLGVGAKLFTVAGPVLVYGMAAAFVVGAVRLALGVTGP